MDSPEAREFIVKRLAQLRDRNELITEVCERYGYRWNEAEEFVGLVEQEDRERIEARQKPLLAGVSLMQLIGGLVIAAGVLAATLYGVVIIPVVAPIPYLGNAIFFVAGLGLALRGAFSLIRTTMRLD